MIFCVLFNFVVIRPNQKNAPSCNFNQVVFYLYKLKSEAAYDIENVNYITICNSYYFSMICTLFHLIAQLLLHILLTKHLNLPSHPYLNNIRVGKVVFFTAKLQTDQLNVISTSYNNPLPKNAEVVCHAVLNSFSMPQDLSLRNRVRVVSGNGCTESYISLAIFCNNFNHNIVSYFVLNQKVIDSLNFMAFQAQFFLKDHSTNLPLKIEQPLKKFNTSNQVKALSFFSGFQLSTSLSESQRLVTPHYGFAIQILNINSSVLAYTVNQKWKRIYEGNITILFILYNQQFLNPPQTTLLKVNSLKLTNFKNIIINEPQLQNEQAVSLFMGVSEIASNNHFTFQVDLITHGRISISSSSQDNVFKLTYLIFPRQATAIQNQQIIVQQNILTDTTAQSNSSPMTMILIVVAAVSAVLAIVIIVCCLCCKKQPQQLPNQHNNEHQQQQLGQSKEQNASSLIRLKRSRLLIDQLKQQICNVCLLTKTHLMTHCQHFFHLQCLKKSLRQGQHCPECRKQLLGRKITVFCRNCSLGYVFALEQSMVLDDKLGVDSLCQKCREQEIPETQKEMKSEKSEQVWLQYAIQNNQNLFLN